MFSCSFEKFSYFLFHFYFLDFVRFQYSQVLVIFFFFKCLEALLISQYYSFSCFSFTLFHYQHKTFLYAQFYNRGEIKTSLKMLLWIFFSASVFPSVVNSMYQFSKNFVMKFLTFSDILYTFRESIIQVYGTIS